MTLPDQYFDDVYAANEDPWNFENSEYEAAKYRRTLAALPRARYRRALEVGCSIGVLTQQLAPRTDTLLCTDVSDKALRKARARNASATNVTFERRRLPEEMPDGPFDLALLSEVGYYLAEDDLRALYRELLLRLSPGAHLLLVHWTPHVHDYPLSGDTVHELALAHVPADLSHLHGERHEQYRLDLFERV